MASIGRKTDHWGSRFGFIMAAVGSSVGLGNFWRFPYTAGENGGGAFVLIYLLCVAFIGLPLLMAEYSIGRKSGRSAIEGVQALARGENKSAKWGIVGWVGTFAAFFILTFYMVISAWLLAFLIQSIGGFGELDAASSGANFNNVIGQGENANSSKWYMMLLLAFFIAANVVVVGRGVKGGLEKAATILMPAFFVMLVVVVAFALMKGDVAAAADFIFKPKWEDVGFGTFLAAIGQAFFSLGVGVGLMITYGAYLQKDTDIKRSSFIVAGADTLVALIAGFAIFPIVFAAGLDPAGGPSLFFVSMPVAFGDVPGGAIFASIFFALALFAAFTSSISLLEVSVSWLEERQGVSRFGASLGMGVVLFLIGAAYVFSPEYLDFIDFVTECVLLPVGGMLAAIFAGWILSRTSLVNEMGEGRIATVWLFLIRWFVPGFIVVILVFGFLDKIQDAYGVQLPSVLQLLLGPNS